MIRYPSALQRLAGLRSGIIELARLADDDRASADDEDGFDVCAFWHKPGFYCGSEPLGYRPRAPQPATFAALSRQNPQGRMPQLHTAATALFFVLGCGWRRRPA